MSKTEKVLTLFITILFQTFMKKSMFGKPFQNASQYEAILRVIEDERDFYKREYEMAKAVSLRSPSPTRLTGKVRWFVCCLFGIERRF